MRAATVLLRRDAGDLLLGRTRYAPGLEAPTHTHENARLVLVLRGSFAERHAGRSRRALPYLAFYRPPGEPHGERFGPEGATCISVDLPAAWLARSGAGVGGEAGERHGLDLATQVDELDAELSHWDGSSVPAVEGLVLEILAEVAATGRADAGGSPIWWRRMRDRIHDGFRGPLTLPELAAAAGVHPVHLARTVRARTGRTVGAHLRELRLRWARAELLRSDAPAAAIAAAAGFSDESHLGRTMKRLTGQTPGQLRRGAGRRRRGGPAR